MIKRFSIPYIFLLLWVESIVFGEGIWHPPQLQIPNRLLVLRDIYFADARNGWVVGQYLFRDNAGVIAHTDGSLWVTQHSSLEMYFSKIFFLNNNKGWVIGRSREESAILVTENGGKGWKEQGRFPWALFDFHFANPKVGWAVGSNNDNKSSVIIHTEDGGNHWKPQYEHQNEELWDIYFVDESHGLAVGQSLEPEKPILLRTDDAGKHWERSLINVSIWEMFFINSRKGWAVGGETEADKKGGVILVTSDSGKSWTIQKSGIENFLFNVYFVDEKEGWVTGRNVIFHTKDGGVTWTKQGIDDGWPYGLFFLDAKMGWIAGEGGILQTTDGGETWNAIYQRSFRERDLNAVYFPNSIDGWVVGKGGSIFHTNDSGMTWTLQDSPTSVNLFSIHFTNAQEGWIVGEQGTILHTNNNGVTWERQQSGTSKQLNAVFFISEKEGWIVGGKPGREDGIILRTFDGGQRWKSVKTLERCWLNDVQFVNAQKGWIVGLRAILHTKDGGESWQEQQCDGLSTCFGVYFIDEQTGWIVDGQGTIAHTVDSGLKWIAKENLGMSLRDVFFANRKEGWVLGESGFEILHTIDGGKTWTSQTTALGIFEFPPGKLRGFCYGGSKRLWAVGEKEVCLNYFDPSLRVIQPSFWAVEPSGKDILSWGDLKKREQRSLPSENIFTNQLYQNYPNPFNHETFLPYQLVKDSEVAIRIYNVKGQLVRKLLLGKKQAGWYLNKQQAARWDGRDSSGTAVPSGMYFYTLTAGEYTATRKLILLK